MLKNLLNKLLLNYPKIEDLNIKQHVLIESINDLDRQLVQAYRRIEDAVAFDEKTLSLACYRETSQINSIVGEL